MRRKGAQKWLKNRFMIVMATVNLEEKRILFIVFRCGAAHGTKILAKSEIMRVAPLWKFFGPYMELLLTFIILKVDMKRYLKRGTTATYFFGLTFLYHGIALV